MIFKVCIFLNLTIVKHCVRNKDIDMEVPAWENFRPCTGKRFGKRHTSFGKINAQGHGFSLSGVFRITLTCFRNSQADKMPVLEFLPKF